MPDTNSEAKRFGEALKGVEANEAATAKFLAAQLKPDFAKWGLKDAAATLGGLDLKSAVAALANMKGGAQAALEDFAKNDVAHDDVQAQVAFLKFRKEGAADADVLDVAEARMLAALLEAVVTRKEAGWSMLEMTARHLAAKEAANGASAEALAVLKKEVANEAGVKFAVGEKVLLDYDVRAAGAQESGGKASAVYEIVAIDDSDLSAVLVTLRAADGKLRPSPVSPDVLTKLPAAPAADAVATAEKAGAAAIEAAKPQDKEKAVQEKALEVAATKVEALQAELNKAAPGSAEAKAVKAELGEAMAALKGLKDPKALDRATDDATDLDKDARSNETLKGLLKFLKELLEKVGFRDSKFLKDQLDRVEGKLAAHEWGAALPADFNEKGDKNPKYAKEQAKKFEKNEKALADFGAKLDGFETAAALTSDEGVQAELAAFKKNYPYNFESKFQAAYEARLQLLGRMDNPDAPAAAAETAAAKTDACVKAFGALADGDDLMKANPATGVPFFSFDQAAAPWTRADGRQVQRIAFLGVAMDVDVNADEVSTVLKSVTRCKVGDRDGVKFNDGYLPMSEFKAGLALIFAGKPAHFDFQGLRVTAVPPAVQAPTETVPAPTPAPAGNVPATVPPAYVPGAPEAVAQHTQEYSVEVRDGQIFLLGRDGTVQSAPVASSPETKAAIEQARLNEAFRKDVEKFRLYDAVYTVWRAKATAVDASMWRWLGMRAKGPEIMQQAIKGADEAHAAVAGLLEGAYKKGQPVPDFGAKYLDGAFWPMVDLEKEYGKMTHVFGAANLASIRETVKNYDGSDYNGALAKVSGAMRDTTLNGGRATGVADVLADQALATEPKLADLSALFADEAKLDALVANVKNSDTARFKDEAVAAGFPASAISGLRKALRKIDKNYAGMDEDALKASISKDHPEFDAQKLEAAVQSVKANSPKFAKRMALKHAWLSDKVSNDSSLAAGNPLLAEYSDAKGLGGAFDFSDETIGTMSSLAQELAIQIAIMTASAGAVGMVGKGVAWLGTAAGTGQAVGIARVTGMTLQATNTGTKVVATGWKGFAAKAAIDGVVFYETYNTLNNAVHKNLDGLFDGAGDAKEIGKSIALMGIMAGFAKMARGADAAVVKYFEGMSKMQASGRMDAFVNSVVPRAALTSERIGLVLAEAGVMVGASQAFEVAAGNDWNPTFTEYAQALVMIGALRGMQALQGKQVNIVRDPSSKLGFKLVVAGAAPAAVSGFGKEGMKEYLQQKDRATQSRVENARYESAAAGTARLAAEANAGRRAELAGRRAYVAPTAPEVSAPAAKPITEVYVSASKISINGTNKSLPGAGAERLYTAENVRIAGNVDGTYRVTSADGKVVRGDAVPRAQLRDLLLGRTAAPAAETAPRRTRADNDAATNARYDAATAATRELAAAANGRRAETLAGRRAEALSARRAELLAMSPMDALAAVKPGETLRFGTLAQGAGDYATVRRVDGKTCEIVEVRGGVAQPARTVENLRFEAETGGKVFTRMVGTETAASGAKPYEFANVREIF